ncbi:MAG: chromosome segregation protein SMC [Armatimonadota bacterium]
MYLKQLDIHGFKTFAQKTQIVFNPGITCVVGPNGSGKSNISDAILWVLGENNVRELRGSSAQDVIFAGNDRRRPLGMAEVSLTLDNSDRALPLDFTEITVTRRLYRSGESEFRINQVPCRLRDIYELFLDTGVGRDAYSLVNQGEIDQILSVRAEDRREIFEEAAGIKKYRVRKKEAERKLEHTQQNLLRVNDIVAEIEAQLGPLQRQAAAAKRFRELSARLLEVENAWYGAKLRRFQIERGGLAQLVEELHGERKRLEEELAAGQAAEAETRKQLEALEVEAEALRRAETDGLKRVADAEAEKARAEERAGEVQRRLRTLAKELDELAGRIEDQVRRSENTARDEAELKREVDQLRQQLIAAQGAAREKTRIHQAAAEQLELLRQAWLARARRQSELEARAKSLAGRVESLAADRKRAAESLEDAEAELERIRLERESFQKAAAEHLSRAEALTGEIKVERDAARAAEQALTAARGTLDRTTGELSSHSARLQALTELGERGEGAAAGARQLLAAARRREVAGEWSLLVERLQVPAGLEKAVEAALGVYADAVLADSPEAAAAALRWLKGKKLAALLLPGEPLCPAAPLPASLGEQVTGEGPALAWARLLLGRVRVCEPEALASAAVEERGDAPDLWVARDGSWRAAHGAVGGGALGAEGAAAAMLARRRELETLRGKLPELEQRAADAREAVRAADAELKRLQSVLRERESRAEAARVEHRAQAREADRRGQDVGRAQGRLERAKAEVARLEREAESAARSLAAAEEELKAPAATDQTDSEESVSAARTEVGRLELEAREAERAATELRVRLAEQEQKLQGAIAASRRAVEAGGFLDRQRAERLKEQGALTAESEQRRLSFSTLAGEAADAQEAVNAARAQMETLAATRTRLTGEAASARARTQDLNARLRELMERCHRADVELAALDTQYRHLGEQWVESVLAFQQPETAAAEEQPLAEGEEAPPEPEPVTVERLRAAWDQAAAEAVLATSSDPEAEIARLRRQIRALGAVNPAAVEQFSEARERFDFLTGQRADLEEARGKLETAIREIDLASRDTFLRAFREIAAAFDEMFKKLFGGGTTELRLTDPADVLETGIDVIVQPPGKKQQNLLLLSGGERALTAGAMIFALMKVRPSPFCVMDEVDAPLDESNVGRFTSILKEFAHRTQFILVTHNRGTMEAADTLYGVTMEERGVSKVLSCSLADPLVAQVEAEQRAPQPA